MISLTSEAELGLSNLSSGDLDERPDMTATPSLALIPKDTTRENMPTAVRSSDGPQILSV